MAITRATDLSAGQRAMVAQARYTYEFNSIMPQVTTRMELGQGNKSQYIPKFGKVTAKDLTDGVDMTEAQSLTITGTTHTTDEAGCKVIVTDKLAYQLVEDSYKAAGTVIGNAMNKKIDQDGLGLFSGLDTGLGAAAATFSIDYFQAAVSQCLGQDEPVPQPMVGVVHPYQLHEIVDLLATPGTNNLSDEVYTAALRQYWRGTDKLFGCPIFSTGRISVDTADDAYGAVFSKLAFIYLVAKEPTTWNVRDDSLRGHEIGIVSDYAFVEEDGTYGRYLLFDAAAPTS